MFLCIKIFSFPFNAIPFKSHLAIGLYLLGGRCDGPLGSLTSGSIFVNGVFGCAWSCVMYGLQMELSGAVRWPPLQVWLVDLMSQVMA